MPVVRIRILIGTTIVRIRILIGTTVVRIRILIGTTVMRIASVIFAGCRLLMSFLIMSPHWFEIPSKGTSPFTPMGEITVDPNANGVLKLLNNLKIHKAPGPDGLSARVLKECSSEIAPILALIYNETLA